MNETFELLNKISPEDLDRAYQLLDEKGRAQLANSILELAAVVPLDGDSIAASTGGYYVLQEDLLKKPLQKLLRGPVGGFPLLLENPETPDLGHWVLVWYWGNRVLEIFDPTGTPLSNTITNYVWKNNIRCLVYNDLSLQKIDNSIQTCGKWVIYRYQTIYHKRMTYEHFIDHLAELSGNNFDNLDYLICAVTKVTVVP